MSVREIKVTRCGDARRQKRPASEGDLSFGVHFADHMFRMEWSEGHGWHDPAIVPYGPISLDPATLVLHYGQQVFEGMKAFHLDDGGIAIFRPKDFIARLNRSAARICIPAVDEEFFLEAVKELVRVDAGCVPASEGTSLYLRPLIVATGVSLGVKLSPTYLLCVIGSPSGPYYKGGVKPTRILVTDSYVRAVRGGVGEAKTAANYAASLLAMEEAHRQGFTQVLWLDGVQRRYVEEVGTSNIFFVFGHTLVTPALNGSILPGITRDSVLAIARGWGLAVEERQVSIDEVVSGIESGSVAEVFATGTAAVVSPVAEFGYKGKVHRIADNWENGLARRLYDELTGIQRGRRPDRLGWIARV